MFFIFYNMMIVIESISLFEERQILCTVGIGFAQWTRKTDPDFFNDPDGYGVELYPAPQELS